MSDAPNLPQLDHDGDGDPGGSRPKLVWIVVKGAGLQQVASSKVAGAISNGKGRRATERDLDVAGVPLDER